jgi:hypothetical protein
MQVMAIHGPAIKTSTTLQLKGSEHHTVNLTFCRAHYMHWSSRTGEEAYQDSCLSNGQHVDDSQRW